VFENNFLKIFGTKKSEASGQFMIFHNEKLRGIYIAHYIIRAVKSRRLQWAEHVIDMWGHCVQNFCVATTWKTKIQ
jgi:hypothetical protein